MSQMIITIMMMPDNVKIQNQNSISKRSTLLLNIELNLKLLLSRMKNILALIMKIS